MPLPPRISFEATRKELSIKPLSEDTWLMSNSTASTGKFLVVLCAVGLDSSLAIKGAEITGELTA